MKHLTYADKSLLVDTESADLIVDYAVAIASSGKADKIELRGYGADGDEVVGSFVLNSGTILMAETVHTSIPDPDNSAAVEYMRAKLARFSSPPMVQPSDSDYSEHLSALDLD